ncbi:MAG: hypothetical protein NTW33_01265 [Methanoregula sp.]|nr:hypothetical protein [Methanoregula sp.]
MKDIFGMLLSHRNCTSLPAHVERAAAHEDSAVRDTENETYP